MAANDEHAIGKYGKSQYGKGEHGIGEHGIGKYGIGEQGIGEYGIGEYGIGEYGIGEHGIGEHGIGEYGIGEYGIGEYGIGEHGIGEMLRHQTTYETVCATQDPGPLKRDVRRAAEAHFGVAKVKNPRMEMILKPVVVILIMALIRRRLKVLSFFFSVCWSYAASQLLHRQQCGGPVGLQ